jgi:hypothetical protein
MLCHLHFWHGTTAYNFMLISTDQKSWWISHSGVGGIDGVRWSIRYTVKENPNTVTKTTYSPMLCFFLSRGSQSILPQIQQTVLLIYIHFLSRKPKTLKLSSYISKIINSSLAHTKKQVWVRKSVSYLLYIPKQYIKVHIPKQISIHNPR